MLLNITVSGVSRTPCSGAMLSTITWKKGDALNGRVRGREGLGTSGENPAEPSAPVFHC